MPFYYSRREIPLVGFALDAFKECPNGFTDYISNRHSFSATLNNCLRDITYSQAKIILYSLRHSFQNQLLETKALDREQVELMGHKFERPEYGVGVTLAQKLECLKEIQIKSF